jgi:AP endonuclease-2
MGSTTAQALTLKKRPIDNAEKMPTAPQTKKKVKQKQLHSFFSQKSTLNRSEITDDASSPTSFSRINEDSDPPPSRSLEVEKTSLTHLLKQSPIPLCYHRIPSKEFTVNKSGPNKGKRFFVCARPVGPGYMNNTQKSVHSQTLSEYKCNFFQWAKSNLIK